ncbi:MAG: hypothetical protein MI867_04390, partial [Pseudomonadales bacterium]|nr:hypothetical protein [Pseudomonadales bacterium]
KLINLQAPRSFSLYFIGWSPVHFLKAFLKALTSEYLRTSPTYSTELAGSSSNTNAQSRLI